MLTFQEFLKHAKPLNITYKKMSSEELIQVLQPIMCNLCRRIFNPNEKERIQTRNASKILEKQFDFEEWEIVLNKK
ncbi:MAG: hypothetical protein J6V44_12720 [Methanobrevibacter sp.]|nr:hypothetical protein [Methanobrevibacter sp.]